MIYKAWEPQTRFFGLPVGYRVNKANEQPEWVKAEVMLDYEKSKKKRQMILEWCYGLLAKYEMAFSTRCPEFEYPSILEYQSVILPPKEEK